MELKESALSAISKFIDGLIPKKAQIFSYWLIDYIRLLRREPEVKTFRRFKRGDIIKIHLGYRIGSEEGGLHFAVVLTPNDTTKNPVITVAPLTSLKNLEQLNHLYPGDVFIGSVLLKQLADKIQASPSSAVVREVSKLKWGSIVLTNQITTISKLRIYDPIRNTDALSGIRLDRETMDSVDNGIKQNIFSA